ncbi:hypothetical protein [Oceanobacillus iheyensis HTE831]|uniref:ATPase n=1 Tax=Oceanobacillus iheyensis (strain DSM 14371 / CIP 107618 / JCM 11309 / KCTC 3954 / HTE831) TaxID=221109 RepID=Q8EMK7_OCEIH|nr:PRK06851 family protein [Oceanobacillus iheyensis]BAC14791.1 hypothetical protein [Oceanobacillus iheyensis HTE831]
MKSYYYVTANTAKGFLNLLPSNIERLQQVISLKHPSEKVKAETLQKLITKFETNDKVEVLKSALGEGYLDGIIIRNTGTAILNESIIPDKLNNVVQLDISQFTKNNLEKSKEQTEKINHHRENAYQYLETGLRIHDDLEEIYINEMNFERADEITDSFIHEILQGQPKKNREGYAFHRLFGTTTVDGPVNVIPHITENLSRVFYVKGRAGTGKSTFMQKVANACIESGYDTEIYHCSFDPNSLDMVLVPELKFCLFDSTDPHEFFPAREGEDIIDLYEEAVTPGTDEKYADEINKVNDHYKSYMKKGVVELKKAGAYLEEWEEQYSLTEQEQNEILQFIEQQIQ